MNINYFNEDINFELKNKEEITKWINDTVLNEDLLCGDLNYIFTSDKYLLEINKEYLSHNYYTDIVTFSYNEKETISGDIFISIDTIRKNAEKFKVSEKDEIHRVIIHGILHLIGYNDKTDEEQNEMTKKENYYIDKLKNL
ncbi:MAG: rRNA maturation RNase YbeY [Bacteroidota bacterium]|nr:rRNA maturation RNase YbeY [Bacteroidota bacterium]